MMSDTVKKYNKTKQKRKETKQEKKESTQKDIVLSQICNLQKSVFIPANQVS